MESLLTILDASSQDITRCFTSVTINPHGQLCMELNRPIVFAESLIQVARMGLNYGYSVSPTPSSSSKNSEGTANKKAVLIINDSSVLRHMVSSSEGCGLEVEGHSLGIGGISVSEARGVLLVGVVSNLLRAGGYIVHQHRYNMLAAWQQVSYIIIRSNTVSIHRIYSFSLLIRS